MVHIIRMVGFDVKYSYNGFVEHFGMFCMFQHLWPFTIVHHTLLHFVRGYRHNFELSSIQSLCFIITEKNSRGDKLCYTFQILAAKPALDSSQKSRIIKLSNPSLSGAEQAVMFDVKKEGCLMATSVRMHESDKVFVFYSTIYVHVNLCGWNCVWTSALISEFSWYYFFICGPVYVLSCVYMSVCAHPDVCWSNRSCPAAHSLVFAAGKLS